MVCFSVTSSENSDKEQRYRDFNLLILPYPGKKEDFQENFIYLFFFEFLGCEHFRDFSTQDYNGELMFYDWSLPLNDSAFDVPEHLSSRVSADWSFWRVI